MPTMTLYDLQPVANRRFAAFDVDGTILPGYCIFPLFDHFAQQGFVDPGANTDYQDLLTRYEQEGMDYADFVGRSLSMSTEMLDGARVDEADQLAIDFFQQYEGLFPYVRPTIQTYQEKNIATVVVTAEPSYIGRAVAHVLGFDLAFSSRLQTVGGEFEGGVVREVLTSDVKGAYLDQLATAGCTVVAAYGDSVGDQGMLARAQYPYCIDPSDELQTIASERGWTIIDDPHQHTQAIVPDLA